MIAMYLMGMVVGVLVALVLKGTAFRGDPVPFVMELPNYRLPSAKTTLHLAWDKAKGFATKAFTIIFAASVVIWILQTFDIRFNVVADQSQSMLAGVGTLLAPLFAPLGFGTWEAAAAACGGLWRQGERSLPRSRCSWAARPRRSPRSSRRSPRFASLLLRCYTRRAWRRSRPCATSSARA